MSQVECKEIRDGLVEDPEGFLKRNIVRLDMKPETDAPPKLFRRFDFTKPEKTRNGGHVYRGIVAGPDHINAPLKVAYLPWGYNTGYYVVLEAAGGPDIMLTATLSGCSVGYIRAADGAVRVSHHNIQTAAGDDTDDAAQRTSLSFATSVLPAKGEGGYDFSKKKEKGDYTIQKTGFACVYGARDGTRGWRFFAQRIVEKDKAHILLARPMTSYNIASVHEF